MTYEEIEVGQHVLILPNHENKKRRGEGTVIAKEIDEIGGKPKEVVYINTINPTGRKRCHPSVLELAE